MRHFFIFCFINFFFLIRLSASDQNSSFRFIENKGQWDKKALYAADLSSGRMFFEKNAYTVLLTNFEHGHSHEEKSGKHKNSDEHQHKQGKAHAYKVSFIGSQQTEPEGDSPAHYPTSYFKDSPDKWVSGVKSYSRLNYKNLYPGIDLLFEDLNQDLKYSFLLKSGADADLINFIYQGLDSIKIINGSLYLFNSIITLIEEKPVSWQVINGIKKYIKTEYKLNGNNLSFNFPDGYDSTYDLIIDPTIIFSTYTGSAANNWGFTATFDESGNLYSGGIAFELGYPVSFGAFQTDFSGACDVAIMKFSSDGKQRLYATYLGGTGLDCPHSMIVTQNNELLIMGSTGSADFPLAFNGYDRSFNGGFNMTPWQMSLFSFTRGSDIFIVKLNNNGTALAGGTFFGGSGNDGVYDINSALHHNYADSFRGEIILDKDENIYIASHTSSSDIPRTSGSYQPDRKGARDGVIAKFNPGLTQLLWATYLGSTNESACYSIQVGKNGNVVVTGGTNSNSFPVTSGTHKTNWQGYTDGFVSWISNDGKTLLYSTYIGTSNIDQSYFVQLDEADNVYILGQTLGVYPVVNAKYSNPNSGQFIHKLDPTLSTTIFSTIFGSGFRTRNIAPTAFLVNDCENIYVAGWGEATNSATGTHGLPTTSNAFRTRTDGSDFYLMILERDANSLLFGSFYGAYNPFAFGIDDHVDGGTSRFHKNGTIYQAVCADCRSSNLFPTTPGVWAPAEHPNNNSCTNAAFKIEMQAMISAIIATPSPGCAPLTITAENKGSSVGNMIWDFGDGTTLTSNSSIVTHTYSEAGKYIIRLRSSDALSCIEGEATDTILVFKLDPFVTPSDTICVGDTLQLFVQPETKGNTYQWSPDKFISSTSISSPKVFPMEKITYKVSIRDTNNCRAYREVTIDVVGDLKAGADNVTECTGPPMIKFLNNTEGGTFLWDFGDGNTSTEREPLHVYQNFGEYSVVVKKFSQNCEETDTIKVRIEKIFLPNLITPNGDGFNDNYYVSGIGKGWTFEVFNRWGEPVFRKEDYDHSWKGESLPEGVYYYLLTSPRGAHCKGWVHVLR
ncbi:MAG: PKD domain-containing protein [Cytophagaceae bacterium]